MKAFDFIEFWLYTQDLASQLYHIAEYSRCPVYQVLHQVAEDLDTKKNTRGKPKLVLRFAAGTSKKQMQVSIINKLKLSFQHHYFFYSVSIVVLSDFFREPLWGLRPMQTDATSANIGENQNFLPIISCKLWIVCHLSLPGVGYTMNRLKARLWLAILALNEAILDERKRKYRAKTRVWIRRREKRGYLDNIAILNTIQHENNALRLGALCLFTKLLHR